MLLNIQQAQFNEGKAIDIDLQVPIDNEIVEFRGYTFAQPVTLKGSMVYEFETLKIVATAQAKLNVVCDTCGEEFVYDVDFDIEETFVHSVDEFNNYYELGSNTVEISKPLIDNLLVSLPSRLMCKPDCKGLCRHCGKNLNQYQCNCEEIQAELEKQNNPFYKLKNLDKNN